MPTIRDGLEMALEHHRAGRLQEAEALYRQLIDAAPMQPDPYHLMGVIATQVGRYDIALDFVQRAIKLNSFAPQFYNTQGVALEQLGRLDEAVASFEQAINMNASYVEGYFNLARLHNRRGHADKAVPFAQTTLRLQANHVDALLLLANIYTTQRKFDEAAELLRQGLRVSPDHIKLVQALGTVRLNQGRFAEAAERFERVLAVQPQQAEVQYQMGIALQQCGRLDEAEQHHRQSLALQPNQSDAHNNLGICLALRGRLDESLVEFNKALELAPTNSEIHSNIGNIHLTQGRHSAAVAAYRESIRLNDQNAQAYNNISAALAPLGHLHEAAQCGELAVRLNPNYADALNNLGNIYKDLGWFDQSYRASREALRLRPDYTSSHCNLLMTLNYDPRTTPEQIAAEHFVWSEQHGAQVTRFTSYENQVDPERPLRIGYVSPDFRQHPVTDFLFPILQHHDRAKFSAHLFSNSGINDPSTLRAQALAAKWNVVLGRSDAELAQLVREQQIDILVDLAGHTAHNRLLTFAMKPAPVQATYLGYPSGTGLPTIDYLITDTVVDRPEDDAFYVEKLVRLPGCFSCWQPPEKSPPVKELPALKNGYITFGSTHAIMKLNPGVLAVWAQILQRVPNSKLFLGRTTIRGPAQEQILGELGKHGIGPERVQVCNEWQGDEGHWQLYHQMDFSLDVFPWCGHTTVCEALWMGVPSVTLYGNRHAGRMVASVLTAAGLADWIAYSPEEYIQRAIDKASDVQSLAKLRTGLREQVRGSALCDGATFTRGLEAAYRQMWRTWCEKIATSGA